MAVTQNSFTGNGSKTDYDFTFPYLKQSEIKASLDGVVTTDFTHLTATRIQFHNGATPPVATAPAANVKIKIYRETDTDSLAATFYAGSAIKSEDLNDNYTQNLYAVQEVTDRYVSNLGGSTMTGDLLLGEDVVVKFEGATDNANETTLTVADPSQDNTITLPDVTGTVVTTGDTGTVARAMIAADAINGTKIADDSVDSEHIVADSLDTEHYAANSVDTTAIAADAVTGAQIADNAINSEHYTDGSIDREHLAADIVDGTKIADDAINSEHYAADSIDTEHYAPNSVDADALAHTSVTAGTYSATDLTVDAQGRITAASSGTIARSEIAADAIDGTKLADNAVDSEHYADGSIDHVHLANDVIDGDNIQDDVINSEHYAAGSIDEEHIANLQVTTAKLAADAVTGAKIADDQVDSEHIVAGSLDNEHYAAGSITSDKLNGATVVTASEQATASANDTSFFTTSAADARYFNISTGDTIKDGQTFPDNDTTIATTAAINDRIIDLVDDVGGFVPIANETSFPTANPDVNNGAGTLVSIKALSSNLVSNGSGVATISNGAGSGNTVTITGLANSTTYAATFGMIVETTSTLHTYTFHRLVPKATEVTTVSGSISNVNTVAGSISNVNAVAGNATNINAVAGNATNINTVAGNNSNITSVAGNSSNINSAVSNATNINTVAGSISNVNSVGGSISNVNTVASNMSTVNDFAARYRVASSAPSSSLDTGDLYFDTTGNELKVYNGSAWQGGVTATGNLLSKAGDQMTGNLTFSGSQTVDGRDVSVDGAKLDGIESGATADQTNAEIRAAVEAASDSNVFTDADHSKLNAIEAGATADQTKSDIDALNINADTVDSLHAASFLRSDANTTASGKLTLGNTADEKLILNNSSNPYIRWQEGTTNKAFIQYSSGVFYLVNQHDGSQIRIEDDIKFTPDNGSNVHKMWHAGNDGSGSGLDADTLDGVQGGNYLRSDTSDIFNGVLTVNTSANEALIVTGPSDPYIRLRDNTNAARAYWQYSSGDVWFWNEYRGQGLKLSTQPYFYHGSAYREILHQNNVGSGGALSSSSVYVNKLYATNGTAIHSYGWNYFENTVAGLYWNGGSGSGWHIYPTNTNYMGMRSGSTSQVALQMKTSDNTIRGYLYGNNSNHIGLLDQTGNWSLRTDRQSGGGGGTATLFDQHFVSDTDGTYSLGFSNQKWNQVHANTIFDSKGNLRSIPIQSNSGSHTLTAASAGKVLYTDANTNVNNSVFSAGDAVTIVNNSGSDQTITQGSGLTLYNTADASTGNRTLASRGMATIWFASASVAYISGAGLS